MSKSDIEDLGEALMLACDASGYPAINRGRTSILAMPRDFVLANLERIASERLDLDEEWHFRRLCELFALLDRSLLCRCCEMGRESRNREVREAVEDFAASD